MLVVLLPLTGETRGLIDASLIAKLRQGGRLGGPSSSTPDAGGFRSKPTSSPRSIRACSRALRSTCSSASRFPPDSRLWRRPDVYVSPHNAATSMPDAILAAVARQIEAFERGEPLQNLVDRRRGY